MILNIFDENCVINKIIIIGSMMRYNKDPILNIMIFNMQLIGLFDEGFSHEFWWFILVFLSSIFSSKMYTFFVLKENNFKKIFIQLSSFTCSQSFVGCLFQFLKFFISDWIYTTKTMTNNLSHVLSSWLYTL